MSGDFLDEERVHVGDIGVELLVEFYDFDADGNVVPFDLTGQTLLKLKMLKPSGALDEKPMTVVGLPTAGVAHYVTAAAGDLNEIGDWKLQGYVEKGGTPRLHSAITAIRVEGNLEAAP